MSDSLWLLVITVLVIIGMMTVLTLVGDAIKGLISIAFDAETPAPGALDRIAEVLTLHQAEVH